jgi:hypothetical protein
MKLLMGSALVLATFLIQSGEFFFLCVFMMNDFVEYSIIGGGFRSCQHYLFLHVRLSQQARGDYLQGWRMQ